MVNILTGISLSAASGFRIFVPFLVTGIASRLGWIELGNNSAWIGTYPAVIIFGAATILEIAGYYNPWIDNMLDLIATPSAIIAGIILSSTVLTDINPFLKWTLSVFCGGGAALTVQAVSVKARALSSFFSSGFGNQFVSSFENISSILISFLSILFPLLALIISAGIVLLVFKMTKIIKGRELI